MTLTVHRLQALGLSSSLAWHGCSSPDRLLSPGSGRNRGKKLQSPERGHGRTVPSVTDADHGSGQAPLRVTEHAIANSTSTVPTCRQIASSEPPPQARFCFRDRAAAARAWVLCCKKCAGASGGGGLALPFLRIPAGSRSVPTPLHAATSTRSSSMARSR